MIIYMCMFLIWLHSVMTAGWLFLFLIQISRKQTRNIYDFWGSRELSGWLLVCHKQRWIMKMKNIFLHQISLYIFGVSLNSHLINTKLKGCCLFLQIMHADKRENMWGTVLLWHDLYPNEVSWWIQIPIRVRVHSYERTDL